MTALDAIWMSGNDAMVDGIKLKHWTFAAPRPEEPWEYEIDNVADGKDGPNYYYAPLDSPRIFLSPDSDPLRHGGYGPERKADSRHGFFLTANEPGALRHALFRLEPDCYSYAWGQWYVLASEHYTGSD